MPIICGTPVEEAGQMLGYVVSFGRRVLPGALGRWAVLREAEDRLLHMFDRHAGRLRSALVDQVHAAVNRYQRELADGVQAAVKEIEARVQGAAAELRQGESQISRRRSELDELNRQLAALGHELSALGDLSRAAGPA